MDARVGKLIYDYLDSHPEYENSPCHILVADFNIDDVSLDFCEKELDKLKKSFDFILNYGFSHLDFDDELSVLDDLRKLIDSIREIPEDERDVILDTFDTYQDANKYVEDLYRDEYDRNLSCDEEDKFSSKGLISIHSGIYGA